MAYTFHDMELDDEDKLDQGIPVACADKPMLPQYPWGLRLTLTSHELEKLGLDPAGAQAGGYVHGHFMAKVTTVDISDMSNGEKVVQRTRIELQIEKLCIESEDEENEEAEEEEEAGETTPRRNRIKYRK